ncbi:MAG: BrnT family toxin [Beijerinckiaceae bacterium]
MSFENARAVFADAFAVEVAEKFESYGEERFNIIGMAYGRLIFVAYAMRGERIRIISARGAEPYEQRTYFDSNG